MDGNAHPVSPDDLYARLGTASAPLLIDVRRAQAFETDDRLIVGSARRLPDKVSEWLGALPPGRGVVAYCVHGHEVSHGVAYRLRDLGLETLLLEGGIESWKASGGPVTAWSGGATS